MDASMLTFGALALAAVGLVVYSLMPHKKTEERDVVKRRLTGRAGADDVVQIKEQARRNATEQLVRKAAPVLTKLVMPVSDAEQTTLRAKLAAAGFRGPHAQTVFLASKTIFAVLGLIAGITTGFTTAQPIAILAGMAAFGAGGGLVLPELWLMVTVSGRKEKIKHGLPDTLDLLVVSVESGLALDAALKRVGDEMASVHPELSEELRIATMESQMGLPRSEALDNMARRCGVDEMRSLVSVVLQAEKFGTSIAKALRNQADSLRTKRRQAAEERAQKTAVKLMIPLVLFIFPAMGVVLGGPAVLNILRAMRENPVPGL
jgi:tight adherence protein C